MSENPLPAPESAAESAACAAPPLAFLHCGGTRIATRRRQAANAEKAQSPLFWLGGYRSDMEGTKAQAVDRFAAAHGLAAVRFDYSGHGSSEGDFYQGTISLWLAQALCVLEQSCGAEARPVLIGSSMGGWIALRMAQELRRRGRAAKALILLAPAPDFTELLVKPRITAAEQRELAEKGFFTENAHGFATPYSRALLEDGPQNCVLGGGLLQLGCPVHIVQGMQDDVVPYRHALRLMEHLPQDSAALTLTKDGDHRLSRPQDIVFMEKLLETAINPL